MMMKVKTTMRKMTKTKWINIAIITSALLLFFSGFAIGYLYYYSQSELCETNPFVYGIKEVNRLNNEKFLCACNSQSNFNKGFTFSEEGINTGS